jgi:hypothetical protein
MTTYIKFDVTENRYNTSERDPHDEWSRASTDANVAVNSATKVDEDGFNTLGIDDVAIGDTIFLLWATYYTGDSFGSDGGNYELLEVCKTEDEAHERELFYRCVTDYSVPWNGYFNGLESTHIDSFTLQG